MAKASRALNDPYRSLSSTQLLITNLPITASNDLNSESSVKQFLLSTVHKDLQVKSVKFINALEINDMPRRTAFIKVEVGSKRQVEQVRQALRKTWVQDSLLKVKTQSDVKAEAYDNRTVVVQGIPKHMRAEVLLQQLFGEDAGAVVGVEMPQVNQKLQELRREIANRQD